ncbi:MAG: protein kinase [Candidatus Edwardsbacteria bacterium]|nr:protein kinase [Candidatus Edwardsbacteria bacterium]
MIDGQAEGIKMSISFPSHKNTVWKTKVDVPFAQGGNSRLFEVWNDGSDKRFALKLYKASDTAQKRKERFYQEIEIVKKLENIPGCIQLIDYGEYEGVPFFVMPFFANGTIKEKYLDIIGESKIELKTVLRDFLKILFIVKDIHTLGLAIRDIKPQNILVDENNDPIITDFGLSLWLNTDYKERLTICGEIIGSAGYTPPEWSETEPSLNHFKGDIWSLGRCLWAMCAGKHAPRNFDTLGGEDTHLSQYISKEFANYIQGIVTSCTNQSPSDRPNIDALISETKKILSVIETGTEQKLKTSADLKSYIKTMSGSILNSRVVLDSKRVESEINIKLTELNQATTTLNDELQPVVDELNNEYKEIGRFRTIVDRTDWTIRIPDINISKNKSWKKSVTLRFDPNQKTTEHNNMSYIIMKFQFGLSEDRSYFWSVYSRDQGMQIEKIYESLTSKSIIVLISNKIAQIPYYTRTFIEIILKHFQD